METLISGAFDTAYYPPIDATLCHIVAPYLPVENPKDLIDFVKNRGPIRTMAGRTLHALLKLSLQGININNLPTMPFNYFWGSRDLSLEEKDKLRSMMLCGVESAKAKVEELRQDGILLTEVLSRPPAGFTKSVSAVARVVEDTGTLGNEYHHGYTLFDIFFADRLDIALLKKLPKHIRQMAAVTALGICLNHGVNSVFGTIARIDGLIIKNKAPVNEFGETAELIAAFALMLQKNGIVPPKLKSPSRETVKKIMEAVKSRKVELTIYDTKFHVGSSGKVYSKIDTTIDYSGQLLHNLVCLYQFFYRVDPDLIDEVIPQIKSYLIHTAVPFLRIHGQEETFCLDDPAVCSENNVFSITNMLSMKQIGTKLPKAIHRALNHAKFLSKK